MSQDHADSGRPVQAPALKENSLGRSSPLRLVAGIFFLLWAAIFLTWTPVNSVRLVNGIIFVPIGLTLTILYFVARSSTQRWR